MAQSTEDKSNSISVKITDDNETSTVAIDMIDGKPSIRTVGTQNIELIRGFDPICDTWFFIGTEQDSSGIGDIGDQIRIQIAASTDNPTSFPAVDLTYTITGSDTTEEILATNIESFLNSESSFNNLWKSEKISNSGVVYISSKKPGSQFERPNSNDFLVTATGTTVVTPAFDNIIRRNKVTTLSRDPTDPRQGILGIQGSVITTIGEITSKEQIVFSNLLVNGSSTPVNFRIEADPTNVKFINSVTFSSRGNGIKFGQFLSKSGSGLSNGIELSYKSKDVLVTREPLKTTDDILDFHAEDPDNFGLFIQSGGDKIIAILKFRSPIEIRPQSEFAINDFLQIKIQDDLTSGITQLRAIIEGFSRGF